MKRGLNLWITLLFVALFTLNGYAVPKQVSISTIEELIEYAAKDNVDVTMKRGTYKISDPKMAKRVVIKKYSATSAKENQKGSNYAITTYLHFSGNNSTYNLNGVKVLLSGDLHESSKTGHIFEMFVTGNNNTINGLAIRDEGDVAPHGNGAIMVHVMGDNNTLDKVNLFIKGSSPYGYGHLLGKGKPAGLVKLHKHSSLLVSGRDTKLLGCKVVTRGYGHGIVMQGAVNTYIEGCYVEGEVRSTDDMLNEKSGPAFDCGFKSIYPPGVIEPNRMIALSECGIRTYPYGGYVGRRTEGVTVINSTIKNMRSGVDLGAHIPPTIIKGCTAIGCQEHGFAIGSEGVILDSRGDAQYGPLLTFQGTNAKNCYVELELIPTESKYKVTRLAEISGSGHYIKLTNRGDQQRETPLPIVFGESFWGDVHKFRQPNDDYSKFAMAKGVTLINETGMPTIFSKQSEDCRLFTNGEVTADEGKNNSIYESDTNINVYNRGVGGNSSAQLLARVYSDVVSLNPDLTIVMVGTNDLLNSKKITTYEKYRENYIGVVKALQAAGSDVMLMSSLPADYEYLKTRHDVSKYAGHPTEIMNKAAEIVKGVAAEYGCYFVDLHAEFAERGLPKHNEDIYIRNQKNSRVKDGVHPTPAGYKLMSEIIARYFEEHRLQSQYKTVVCFGDSITRGGDGSVTGKNYPSYLNRYLNKK